MFQPDYIHRLLEIGAADAVAAGARLAALLTPASADTEPTTGTGGAARD